MRRLVVIVPSRGRPQNIERLLNAWRDTRATATLLVALDQDDPTAFSYMEAVTPNKCAVAVGPRRRLCGTLNHEAAVIANKDRADIIGFFGDDYVPRTENWDNYVRHAFDGMESGIVYANDLSGGSTVGDQVFISADLVRVLGYMAPSVLTHTHMADAWTEWGESLGRLRYLPDVEIERVGAEKAPFDFRHDQANSFYEADGDAYHHYKLDGAFERDLRKLKRAISGAAIT